MNQLGNRVEAGRDTSTSAFAHRPSGREGIHAPYAIAAGGAGIWFTEYSATMLGRMEPAGAFNQVELDVEGFPERLTVARDGAVWFTDPQGGRIGRISPDSNKADYYFVPTPKSGPASIAAARDGSIWFTEHAADQIAIFVPAGADRPSPGRHGFKEFALPLGGGPAGITAAADGSLWFAENSGNRIGRIYVILSDLINDLWDVQTVVERVASVCTPATRVIINTYSRMWEPPLRMAARMGLGKPNLFQNWLTVEDISNLLGSPISRSSTTGRRSYGPCRSPCWAPWPTATWSSCGPSDIWRSPTSWSPPRPAPSSRRSALLSPWCP